MTRRSAKRRGLLLLVGVAALLALAAAGCGGGQEGSAETTAAAATTEAPAAETEAPPATTAEAAATEEAAPEPASLKVALDWFANPDHVALFYALDKGMWSDLGLTVALKTPSDPSAGLKLVATGKFDLAVYYQGDMFYAGEQGLPVVAVGSLVPVPLNSMIALADSSVKGPDTVKGATIGNAGLPFDDAVLQTIRQQQGLSEDEVTSVNVGFNLVPALLSGKVDAVIGAYWNIEAPEIEIKTGTAPTVVQLDQLGVPTYNELVIVANKERLESDSAYADAVSRFIAGMIAGTEGAIADPTGADAIMKANSEYSAKEINEMVPTTLGVLTPPNGLSIGCFDLDAWSTFGQWMTDNGLVKKPVDSTTIATNDYNTAC
jgi:putative hydroxymethylpyrimidine transport system substrate-binding protein